MDIHLSLLDSHVKMTLQSYKCHGLKPDRVYYFVLIVHYIL